MLTFTLYCVNIMLHYYFKLLYHCPFAEVKIMIDIKNEMTDDLFKAILTLKTVDEC